MTGDVRDLGMVGLGVMGRNLLLNAADKGFSVAGYDRVSEQRQALRDEAGGKDISVAESIAALVSMLQPPRAVMLLVPSGPSVDDVIGELAKNLMRGDIIIDAGNSYFKDTDRRAAGLEEKGIRYLGVGVSGGAAGARHGASIMGGGPLDAYEQVRPIFEAVAAHVNGNPCAAWLGPRSAGHYVKMVHNGIEYGIMQLIAECYDVMNRSLGLSNDELHDVFAQWNRGKMTSFLLEITAKIFLKADDLTNQRLINVILDESGHLGTGMWTSESTLELHLPAPTIDMAVVMRDMSSHKNRLRMEKKIGESSVLRYHGDRDEMIRRLESAFQASAILTYAQGMALLGEASQAFKYGLDLATVARVWQGGCIIRSELLEDIKQAFNACPNLTNLLMDGRFAEAVKCRQEDLRWITGICAKLHVPISALMVSLSYWDAFQSEWLPANLIQAQRDYFGWHTYQRVDQKGVFHTHWGE